MLLSESLIMSSQKQGSCTFWIATSGYLTRDGGHPSTIYHICLKAVEARLLYTKLIRRVLHHGCSNDTTSAHAKVCRGQHWYLRLSYVEFRSMPARESNLQIPVSHWTRVQQAVVSAALVRCRHVSASEIVFNKPKRIPFFESASNSLIVKVIHTSSTCISL
jgi:hypothetical protein